VVRTGDASDASWMRSRFLTGLGDAALRHLFDTARVRHIAPKKDVIIKGERPDHLLLLRTGRTRAHTLTESGSEIGLMWVAPGGALELVSLLANPPTYLINATTVTPRDFLFWDHDTIRKPVTTHPRIIGAYMKRHLNLVTKSAESRLAHRLIEIATSAGEVGNSGITIDITNEQLGSLSDIGYFTTQPNPIQVVREWDAVKTAQPRHTACARITNGGLNLPRIGVSSLVTRNCNRHASDQHEKKVAGLAIEDLTRNDVIEEATHPRIQSALSVGIRYALHDLASS